MRRLLTLARLLLGMTLVATPNVAFASGADISDMFLNLIFAFAPLWIVVAILVIVIAGFSLMVSNDEGRLEKTRKTIVAVIIGGIVITIILVLGPLAAIGILYNGIPGMALINTGDALGNEAIGIAEWITAMAAMLGVLIIIISALQAIFTFGDEEAYQKVRASIRHVILGLIIIAAAFIFRQVFFVDKTPNALIALIASKILIVLAVMTIIAVAILIYAGVRMIIAFGREEDYTNAKTLVFRVIIGLVVILVSYVLVLAVATLFNGTGTGVV